MDPKLLEHQMVVLFREEDGSVTLKYRRDVVDQIHGSTLSVFQLTLKDEEGYADLQEPTVFS